MPRTTAAAIAKPRFFPTPGDFRTWLEENHQTPGELLVGFHKKDSGTPSITWPEAVDQALCYGWIDGVRRSLDASSYTVRFTRRRPSSVWSDVNIGRARELIAKGLMRPSGLAAFEARSREKPDISYETRAATKFDAAAERRFQTTRKAWEFFQRQPPWYRRIATFWVVSAKREETRARRLAILIEESERERRVGPVTGRAASPK